MVLHYKAALAVLIISIVPVARVFGAMVKWWYEVKEAKRRDTDRKLNDDKERILLILRSEMAHPGLNGQTFNQLVSGLNPKLSAKRLEMVLRSLANENPSRIHCFGGRWYLGPLPSEICGYAAHK